MSAAPDFVDPAPHRSVIGIGRVAMWKGGSVWIGRNTGQAQAHCHHAIQITLTATGTFRIRGDAGDVWRKTSAALVMPDRWHVFDGCGHTVAIVFVEPETAAGRTLIERHGQQDISLLRNDALASPAAALLDVFDARGTERALIDAAQRLVEHLARVPVAQETVDRRIAVVIDRIRGHPGEALTLAQAATMAHLSPSRFRHLFVAQTGISFRAYLLWARVGFAVARGMTGGSWTEAAQQAGFADSAHLSRTCRRMFGIAPTMLVPEKTD